MKKSLKYIKVEGKLKSRGEYLLSSAEYRPYESVTFVDHEGEELHFYSLSFSKRMDDNLDFSRDMTFYILRLRQKDKMVGVVYAVECDGDKMFFPDTAIPALQFLGLEASYRSHLALKVFPLSFILVLVCGGALSLAIGYIFGFGTSSAVLGMGGAAFYMYSPVLLFKRKLAGISKAYEILASDGFNTASNVSAKY